MKAPLFSIVTVTLNPGDDLVVTAASILSQKFTDFEWVIKDGGSASEKLRALGGIADPRVRLIQSPDRGIFDAMNQALGHCTGDYVIYMNAGDGFHGDSVLDFVAKAILVERGGLYYCNYYNNKWKTVIRYPATLSRAYLYRRVPCHQAVFTQRTLLLEVGGFRGDDFRIVADHEMMYKIAFKNKVAPKFVDIVCCTYKDDGTHASKAGFARRENERRKLRMEYFSISERFLMGMVYHATMPKFRTWITLKCRGGAFSKMYFAALSAGSRLISK